MEVQLQPGTYVLAISGGVDSMALLHLLQKKYGASKAYRFIVAHLDHGIRRDSQEDRLLVHKTATSFGLPFVFHEANLGTRASEEAARKARYAFLQKVKKASNAKAIVTAHHKDDQIETAILNILRGTHVAGLTSLKNTHEIHRPLLTVTKQNLIDYAKENSVIWREDSTNTDNTYKRNYVRSNIVKKMTPRQNAVLHKHIENAGRLQNEIYKQLDNYFHLQLRAGEIDRSEFNRLPHEVARSVMAHWLRQKGVLSFDSKALERIIIACKTKPKGTKIEVKNNTYILIDGQTLALKYRDR